MLKYVLSVSSAFVLGNLFFLTPIWAVRDKASVASDTPLMDMGSRFQRAKSLPPGYSQTQEFISIALDNNWDRDMCGSDWIRLLAALHLSVKVPARIKALNILARSSYVTTGTRLNAAHMLPEGSERNEALTLIAENTYREMFERVAAAKLLPQENPFRSHFLRSISQDMTIEVWIRMGAAQALPKRDEARIQVLRSIAQDKEIYPPFRVQAAQALPVEDPVRVKVLGAFN